VSDAVTATFHAIGLPWTFTFDAEHVTVINAGVIILLQVVVSRLVRERAALPTMVTGMALGAVGFGLLAASRNPWVFIAGIAVFTLGEMTAHPKYYSFIGLIAPAERKAVYLGYAFLYGVFGSLLGSNLGGFLYERLLKPALGTPAADDRARLLWTLFAVLDVVAVLGLIAFARAFGEDTEATRRRAARVMRAVYAGIGVVGAAFLVAGLTATPAQPKTVVQAGIFLLLAAGGLAVTGARR